jgi:hypothetical protein
MKKLLLCAFVLSFTCQAFTQVISINRKYGLDNRYRDKNFYTTSGVEGAMLQMGTWESPMFTNISGKNIPEKMIPRFTYFFNMGADYNYQIDKNLSVFTGLNLKNIGLIMKLDSVKNKYAVYTIGAPVGLRIHNADRTVWFKTGIDFSFALHYKNKKFLNDKRVSKYSEWFSDRAATFYPSVFAGLSVSGITLSTNVYLCNFFNEYNGNNYGYKASLVTVGLGINYTSLRKHKKVKDTPTEVAE